MILEAYDLQSCEVHEGEHKDTLKLTAFKGIINDEESADNGNLVKECENAYVTKDNNGYYSITIPNEIGGVQVSRIGNKLFSAYYWNC